MVAIIDFAKYPGGESKLFHLAVKPGQHIKPMKAGMVINIIGEDTVIDAYKKGTFVKVDDPKILDK